MPPLSMSWLRVFRGINTAHLGHRSRTREVRGRIVHWQVNEGPVLRRYTLSISSQIFQVLLRVGQER